MEVDAALVIEALRASRDRDAPTAGGARRFRATQQFIDKHLLALPLTWLGHPACGYVGSAAMSAPWIAQLEPGKKWIWIAIFAAGFLTLVLRERIRSARVRQQSRRADDDIAESVNTIESTLTDIQKSILGDTSSRLTVLLPRKTSDGEYELVPVLRSGGIPVRESRRLRVVSNDLESCEGVCGRCFQADAGALEVACDLSDPNYASEMFVEQPFVTHASSAPSTRRNPSYVLAIVLRFREVKIGVLTVDEHRALNLLPHSCSKQAVQWSSLKAGFKKKHDARRGELGVAAKTLSALAIAPMFRLCGVDP